MEARETELKLGDENRDKLDQKIKGAYKRVLKEYNDRYKDKKDHTGVLHSRNQQVELERKERVSQMVEKLQRSQQAVENYMSNQKHKIMLK